MHSIGRILKYLLGVGMKCVRLFLFFLCLTQKLISSEAENPLPDIFDDGAYSNLIDFNTSPSAIVGGAVNVITGNYVETNTDLVCAGVNPITIKSSFNSSLSEVGELYGYWDLNISGSVEVQEDSEKQYAVVKDRGMTIPFEGSRNRTSIGVMSDIFEKGVVNVPSPHISGRTYLGPKRLQISEGNNCYSNLGFDVQEYLYNGGYGIYQLSKIHNPNGTYHKYLYNNKRVNRIESFTKNGTVTGHVEIEHKFIGKRFINVSLTADDGKYLSYRLINPKKSSKNCYILDNISSNFSPTIKYSYNMKCKKDEKPLVAKHYPNGRFVKIHYNKDKVSKLTGPVGIGGEEANLYHFSVKKGKRQTMVTDARNHKKKYYWNHEDRLEKIEEYNADSNSKAKDGGVYRTEEISWLGSRLGSRSLYTKDGDLLFKKSFQYENGSYIYNHRCHCLNANIEYEYISGNLSGLTDNSFEKYTKHYKYNDGNYVTQEDLGFQIIDYTYYGDSSNIQLKTVSNPNGDIQQRYYFEYDNSATPILTIIDDGSSTDIHDLSDVTQRIIKRVKTTTTRPWGLPEEVSESYLDLASGQEVLIRRVLNTYSRRGLLIREETYDCNNAFAYAKEWKHNSYGLVIEETDEDGQQTIYDYDANCNLIFKQTPNLNYHTEYVYNHMNQLIKEVEVHLDGNRFSKSYSYDRCGNMTRSYDYCGNETNYSYDAFNRLTNKTFPKNIVKKGRVHSAREYYGYNELNHPTFKKDDRGIVKVKTNARGKPSLISYPDGNKQRIVYHLDGTVEKTIDCLGNETHFEYDYLQRKISEKKYTSDGEELSTQFWVYGAFNLLMEVDPEGNATTYEYDGAGRLIAQTKAGSEVRYVYDSLGRQKEKWEQCGEDAWRVSSVEHDVLGQVIEERIESGNGTLFMKKQYAYDVDGNRTHVSIFSEDGISTTITEYNAHNKPVKTMAPDGSETTYRYDYNYINAFDQCVLREEAIDSKGNTSIKEYDARGFVVLEEQKNIYDILVKKTKYTNDCVGNVLKRVEDVIVDDETVRTITTCFEYDSMGRETAVIEAYGEPEQKISRKEYNILGDVARIVKPDGTRIYHHYDSLGRLFLLESSDSSIKYEYAYDRNNNIIEVKDHTTGQTTSREYDAFGHVLSEKMEHGLQLDYSYDLMGRLSELTLPDLSKIAYEYDEGYLRSIHRNGYTHTYTYDTAGKRTLSTLGNNLGEIRYTYDINLQPTGIHSSYWQMQGEYDSCGNIEAVVQTDPVGETTHHYQYDGLNQLTAESGSETHTYQLDSIGNRVKKDEISCVTNALNQLEKQGSTTYTYDTNGNLSSAKGSSQNFTCVYDNLDRLIEVNSGDQKTSYRYDAFHRRMSKTHYRRLGDAWKQEHHERYFYQGDKELGAVDDEGNITQLRVMGIGYKGDIGAAVLMEIEGESYVPLHDYRGNVSVLLNAQSGVAVETYRYTAYGEETVFDSNGNQIATPINPWRFSSKRVDSETGWSYFGARYYDAKTARWTTPDPLWYVDGTNLYCYVQNNPTRYIDPEGLFIQALLAIAIATVASIIETAANNMTFDIDETGNYSVGVTSSTNRRSRSRSRSVDRRTCSYETKDKEYGKIHYTCVNGVLTFPEDAMSNTDYIGSMMPDCSGAGIYNATHGLWDFVECVINLLGFNTRPVSELHGQWDKYFDNCPEGGIITHVCHSQGAILTRNALASYDPERRKRIHVIAVAPAAYIDEDHCGSVMHYVSKNDFIPWFDFKGRRRHEKNITILDRHPNASWFDHNFQSPTYRGEIKKRIKWISNNYGDLNDK